MRWVVRACSVSGAVRHCPAATDLHPTFSGATFVNTNTARIPFVKLLTFGRIQKPGAVRRVQAMVEESMRPPRSMRMDWGSTVIVLPPGKPEVLVFDHVRARRRKGGYKVEFQPDRPWAGLRAVNIIFESSPRSVLAEPLAFELYRRAGVPAPATDHVRLWVDQTALGYHLLIEQPNRAFFRRLGRDPDGNLYKLVWYGRGVIGQHEKRTNRDTGHEDLLDVVGGLRQTEGAAQWDFIRQHFDVEELASYYAVSMCIQNWDGFFNNYYAFHDPRPGGKWEIVPWDQDKTWGDHDGASPAYDWYEMPLTYGMTGDRAPGRAWFGGWPVAGAEWWRPPGHFSGPLLANPQFRQRCLDRLRELCDTVFTPEAFGPEIAALEDRLEPEIPFRAHLGRQSAEGALGRFHHDIESFHRQLVHRRRFLLEQLGPERPRSRSEARERGAGKHGDFSWLRGLGFGLRRASLELLPRLKFLVNESSFCAAQRRLCEASTPVIAVDTSGHEPFTRLARLRRASLMSQRGGLRPSGSHSFVCAGTSAMRIRESTPRQERTAHFALGGGPGLAVNLAA